MRAPAVCLMSVALLAPAAIASPAAETLEVRLSNFRFLPRMPTLEHGRGYTLRLVNASGGSHDFSAPGFFAAARIDPADAALVADGKVEVPGGATSTIHLTAPAAGSYRLKCTHGLHRLMGMKGEIQVR